MAVGISSPHVAVGISSPLLILGAFCGDLPLQYLAGTCSGCPEHGMVAVPNAPTKQAQGREDAGQDVGRGAQTLTSQIAEHPLRVTISQERWVRTRRNVLSTGPKPLLTSRAPGHLFTQPRSPNGRCTAAEMWWVRCFPGGSHQAIV